MARRNPFGVFSPVNTEHLFRRYYLDRPSFVDGTAEFHAICANHTPRGGRILEIGAGPSNATSDYLSTLGPVVGADVTDEVSTNRALKEWRLFDGETLPFDSASFDTCVSNYVMEHVENPRRLTARSGASCVARR